MENLLKTFKIDPNVVLGTGKAAGAGKPGEMPANYQPDEERPLTVYRNVAGCSRKEINDYILFIDGWNWEKYDPSQWPCADLSFPDLDEDKKYDLWPYKPRLDEPHWIDLNNQIKSGIARKIYFEGEAGDYDTPDQYVGEDAMKLLVQFEALEKEGNIEKVKAAGFNNLEHLQFIIATTKSEIRSAYGKTQKIIDESTAKSKEQMNANIDAVKKGGLLDPIQGVSMEDWAAANAKIAGGTALNEVLKILGVERPVWDSVSAEWMSRMTQDTTFAITKVYGDAFTNSDIGKFAGAGGAAAAAGSETVEKVKKDLDLYVRIMCHQNMASTQGTDANAILQQYGLTAADWGTISMHWTSAGLGTDLELTMRMSALMDEYNTKFATGSAADSVEF
jgi:hypothetical protein